MAYGESNGHVIITDVQRSRSIARDRNFVSTWRERKGKATRKDREGRSILELHYLKDLVIGDFAKF